MLGYGSICVLQGFGPFCPCFNPGWAYFDLTTDAPVTMPVEEREEQKNEQWAPRSARSGRHGPWQACNCWPLYFPSSCDWEHWNSLI